MKLIIEISGDRFYAYRESENAFRHNEKSRSRELSRVDLKSLDMDCDLSAYRDSYFVFTVKG